MGNAETLAKAKLQDKVHHLVVFVHGVGMRAEFHGTGLAQAIKELNDKYNAEEEGSQNSTKAPNQYLCVLSRSNTKQGSQWGTFYLTSKGIGACAGRLATELVQLIRKHQPDVLSVVGASFGGIISRRALLLLANHFSDSGKVLPVRLGLFATIASPHLGVAQCYKIMSPYAFGVAQTGKDLWLEEKSFEKAGWFGSAWGSSLASLFGKEHLGVLSLFSERVLYVPLVNDNIVDYATAACTLGAAPEDALHIALKYYYETEEGEEEGHEDSSGRIRLPPLVEKIILPRSLPGEEPKEEAEKYEGGSTCSTYSSPEEWVLPGDSAKWDSLKETKPCLVTAALAFISLGWTVVESPGNHKVLARCVEGNRYSEPAVAHLAARLQSIC